VLACQGCGTEISGDAAAPYRCPRAGTDAGDHVVGRRLPAGARFLSGGGDNPFVRWRELSHAHALARAGGLDDQAFVALVEQLDAAVAAIWGHGFRVTPFFRAAELSAALGFEAPGGVWVKDETGNVSGSHKGRHLMGLAILGEVRARLGLDAPGARLAIASCGNAALAAAVIARAWGRPLEAFVPEDAPPRVVAELGRLGATVRVCARPPGVTGDPCYLAFRRAVDAGATPFCCQGPDNGLTIEGGETLAWEMIADLARAGRSLDRLFVQVGGGALASACVQGFADAGVPLPRLHAVQTRGAFPLRRAWEILVRRAATSDVQSELRRAAAQRAELMWPWETTPRSLAHGILDDETYDWLAILRGTAASGGDPLVVDEARLAEAHRLARERTGIDVDPTGSAGLAGLLELRARGAVAPTEAVAVLFTGRTR
jgi:threonine synthase